MSLKDVQYNKPRLFGGSAVTGVLGVVIRQRQTDSGAGSTSSPYPDIVVIRVLCRAPLVSTLVKTTWRKQKMNLFLPALEDTARKLVYLEVNSAVVHYALDASQDVLRCT